ncbi:uncharacterized protein B0J16DRAFT_373507 [Fusarium flagelliforme]|uniref:Lustrin a-like protein n=1 Tax=Fusarium flagelliforme TaxID=2675880 RepID=A0A395MIX2_9HYPO|nr:uncharacterized protein B0J16DRAFT_373507 [Fusarium flagelliforme]KAH7182952.1 hypothetical protein B0J16DRAFT_373507 [Fusarium flagelliforme]RFN47700.1 hypothetical protein FIE12Z_8037 [Fusarium flagelliforme]
MKSVVASIGMLAAVANAYQFPQHAHYRRDYNGTDSQTTLTVKTTVVETITSCAPTVTNCPSRDQTAIAQLPESDKTTLTATHTVILTEVVCPVAEASSIYTSVLHDAETGGVTGKTITADVPMNTGGAYPPPTQGEKTVVSDYTTDQVVTLTQGEETITTTIHKTIQKTLTVPAGPEVTNDGSKGNGTPEEDSTTTTTKTTTGTITKTIQRVGETGPATGGDNGYSTGKGEGEGEDDGSKGTGNGNGPNKGGNGECVPETVTVTAPASTVYVTVVPEAAKTNGAEGATVTGKTVKGDDSEDDDEEDDDSEEEICDTTTTMEATVTVVPYPVNNTATGGYAKPTGFSRRLR